MTDRLTTTSAAHLLIQQLQASHGAVFFYLSHGCCDGSTPMCLAPGEMQLGEQDVQVGTLAGAGFFMGREQRDNLAKLHLTLDVAPGSNGGFSLEDGSGQRFVLHTRRLAAPA